jgi:CheY-like chemotaxis protein
MPGMDGWQVWERMRAIPALAATPVVILSPNIPDDERAKAAGIREFLRKPIDGSELVAAVDRYCDRKRGPGSPSGGNRHDRPSSPDPA